MKQSVYADEKSFVQAVAQEELGGPLVWADLCHCERQRMLAKINARRGEVFIKELV